MPDPPLLSLYGSQGAWPMESMSEHQHPTPLRRARLERAWTQEEAAAAFAVVAERIGARVSTSARQWRRWEAPHPPWPRRAYRVVLEELFGRPLSSLGFRRPVVAIPCEAKGG